MNTSAIRAAIENKELVEFTYKGFQRVAEPHVYGIHKGKRQLLVYQVGGNTSSGSIPDWRRVILDDISNFKALAGTRFSGPRPMPETYEWDTVITAVK
ncbi:MAG: hypothetical protein ABI347_08505 [Nitrososphaera sp.]